MNHQENTLARNSVRCLAWLYRKEILNCLGKGEQPGCVVSCAVDLQVNIKLWVTGSLRNLLPAPTHHKHCCHLQSVLTIDCDMAVGHPLCSVMQCSSQHRADIVEIWVTVTKKAFKFWHRISGHQHSLLIKWKCPSGKWKLHHYMKGLLFRMWSMLFLYCYVCVVHVHVLDTLCLCRDTTSHRIVSVSTVWGRFLRCIDLSGWRCACTL